MKQHWWDKEVKPWQAGLMLLAAGILMAIFVILLCVLTK